MPSLLACQPPVLALQKPWGWGRGAGRRPIELDPECKGRLGPWAEGRAEPSARRPQVQSLVSRCTCPVQFSMVKVSEGKYRVGDSNTLIFIRVNFGRRGWREPRGGGSPGVSRVRRPVVELHLGLKVRKGDHHPPLAIHQKAFPLSLWEFQKIPGKGGKHVPRSH